MRLREDLSYRKEPRRVGRPVGSWLGGSRACGMAQARTPAWRPASRRAGGLAAWRPAQSTRTAIPVQKFIPGGRFGIATSAGRVGVKSGLVGPEMPAESEVAGSVSDRNSDLGFRNSEVELGIRVSVFSVFFLRSGGFRFLEFGN